MSKISSIFNKLGIVVIKYSIEKINWRTNKLNGIKKDMKVYLKNYRNDDMVVITNKLKCLLLLKLFKRGKNVYTIKKLKGIK